VRLPKILFIIGFAMLIPGIIVATAGPAFIIREEVWRMKRTVLYKDSWAYVDAGQKDRYVLHFRRFEISEAKDVTVMGYITKVAGPRFNFYVFNTKNYILWKNGQPYVAYVEVKNVTGYNFLLHPTVEYHDSLHFVVENPGTIRLTTVLSAVMEWGKKDVIKLMTVPLSSFFLGGCIVFIGFILIIVAAIAKYVFKPKEKPPLENTS